MVRRVAYGIRAGKPRVVCSRTDKGERTGNQVLRKCNPLRADAPCHWAEQKVVVNQGRAMADLNKNVFAKAQLCADFPPAQRLIVVKCIARHARSLRLPVQPQSACTMVNVIMRNDGVNGGVQLNAADFGAVQFLLVVDMVNVVVLNHGENAAKMPGNACLPTVVNVAAADNVAADMRPIPAFQLRLADGVPFILRSMFQPEAAPLVFVIGLKVFAKRNADALALVEFAVFNDPCQTSANASTIRSAITTATRVAVFLFVNPTDLP